MIDDQAAGPPFLRLENASEDAFRRNLPQGLVSVLERRYLASLRLADWDLSFPESVGNRPVIQPITRLSKPRHSHAFLELLPYAISACGSDDHALIFLIDGTEQAKRLWLGGRRLIGTAAGSTEDYLNRVESAFRTAVPGLTLGEPKGMDHEECPDLVRFLQTAPKISLLTGLPSRRKVSVPVNSQTLDHVINATFQHRYVMIAVAEPVSALWMDASVDACRELKSETHTYLRRTLQQSRQENTSVGSSVETGGDSWMRMLPAGLHGLAAFLGLGSFVQPAILAGLFSKPATEQSSRQRGTSQAATVELLNTNAQACEQLLDRHLERLQSARASGWWRVAVYLASESDTAQAGIVGALRSMISGDNTFLDPIRIVDLPQEAVRAAALSTQILSLRPKHALSGHPLGPAFDSLSTCMQSEELGVLFSLPERELPGLPMRDRGTFAVAAPPTTGQDIELGTIIGPVGEPQGVLNIPITSLNRHVFVGGMTGFGKTNTCKRILVEAWHRFQVPFLVIEPAKAEYRQLAANGEITSLRCYAVGQSSSALPLRLNPLAPIPNTPIAKHIDLLKAVFNAAFPMHPGMPYVLEDALIEVYTERGWDLSGTENCFLNSRSSMDARAALTPNLEDLHDKIEQVLNRKQYAKELHLNLGAALRSRLHSLLVGNKGAMLNTRRSTPPDEIFNWPAVVELKELGDDEEKCFVMALLLVLLYEHCEQRRDVNGRLLHLTLIEEAHRLLAGHRGSVAEKTADPRTKAVTMFADLLAELRASGEGFIIADQVPSDLAPQTMKNTGLKVLHRLSAADDREMVGGCANLDDGQMRFLNHLHPGEAIVHDERIGEAVLLKVPLSSPAADRLPPARYTPDPRVQFRHAGCRHCAAPCTFLNAVDGQDRQDLDPRLQTFFEALIRDGLPRAEEAFQTWSMRWRKRQTERSGRGGETLLGEEHCLAVQQAHRWLGYWLSSRRSAAGEAPLLTPKDYLVRETAAQAIGGLIFGLQHAHPHTETAGLLDIVRTAVATSPARERAACSSCPARCSMVGFVGDAPVVIDSTAGVWESASVEEAMQKLERITIDRLNKALPGANPNERRHWLYCFTAQLEAKEADMPMAENVLVILRSTGEPAAERRDLTLLGGSLSSP